MRGPRAPAGGRGRLLAFDLRLRDNNSWFADNNKRFGGEGAVYQAGGGREKGDLTFGFANYHH